MTLIDHFRVAMSVTPEAVPPSWKLKLLHISEESTYMCSPVFVPQIVGGLSLPPPPVTLKVSVKHLVAVVTFFPTPFNTPLVCRPTVVIDVEGPVITNDEKSIRSWHIPDEHGHILTVQAPAFSDPDDSKYVQFSEDVDPQVTLKVQQMPKPSAHDPSLVPPFEVHSAAV